MFAACQFFAPAIASATVNGFGAGSGSGVGYANLLTRGFLGNLIPAASAASRSAFSAAAFAFFSSSAAFFLAI